jgi:hypothetical protein
MTIAVWRHDPLSSEANSFTESRKADACQATQQESEDFEQQGDL